MKKRDTILLLGIFSIAILIIAQVIIIRGVWRQNYEMLDLRYRSLSQEAVATLRGQRSFDVYDTVRFILDRYSEKVVKELPELKDEKELAQKKKDILEYFTLVLNKEQDLSSYLSAYFERMGVDKNFNHSIEISNLEIIGADTFRIYQNEFFRRRRAPPQPGIIPAPTDTKSTKILVYRNRLEDNTTPCFSNTISTSPINESWSCRLLPPLLQ